jgi:hypothetical protein
MNSIKYCSNASKAFVRTGMVLPKNFRFKFLSFLIISFFFFSCGSSAERMEDRGASSKASQEVADSASAYLKGISTDTINGITHNFIRKANLKFKVKDVLFCSKKIEDIVANYGGYVSASELTSNKNYTQSTQINKDSLVEETFFTTINSISIRVPSQRLDTVLRQISDLALFIDYRNLHSDDVKMKLFSNKLAENRYKNFNSSLQQKTNTTKTKTSQVINVEESILNKQTSADEKRIESLELADLVNYSTINIETYQAQAVLKQVLAVPNRIEPYQISFTEKLGNSFLNGFQILKNFILFLVNSWGVILILGVLFIFIKKIINYLTKKVSTGI